MKRAATISLVLIASVTIDATGLQARDCQTDALQRDADCSPPISAVQPHAATGSWWNPWTWGSRTSSAASEPARVAPSTARAAPGSSESATVARGGFGAAGVGEAGG